MSIFEIVKENVPFERYCNDKGITFNRINKTLCPFHDDSNPSFHNYTTHGYCFVCHKRADIIDLECHYEGLSPLEATLSIAKRYGVTLPELSQKDKEKVDKELKAYELLSRLATYANNKIKKYPEAIEFLRSKGLDEGDIGQYLIGYVADDNPLANNLKDKSEIELAEEIGLIHKNDNGRYYDHFRNRIIIPVWNYGRIVYLSGRAHPEGEPKYLHLRNSDLVYKQIAFSENLNKAYCIIVEGIFDAIALLKAGFTSCALLGINLGEHLENQLSKAGAKLYFGLDLDEAGKDASYNLAKEFKGYVLNRNLTKDFDEILAELGIDEFKAIVEKGIKEAEYYLDAVIKNEDKIEALKEIAKLEFESDKEIWINKLAKKHDISKRSLQRDLKAICNKAETIIEDQEPYDPLSEYTEDEIAKAKELLCDPDLLNKIVDQIGRNGYIAEIVNKIVLVLSFTSRLFDEAISNVIKGESSSGKNSLIRAVLSVFPKSAYKEYTRITSQALYYIKSLDLSHKVLMIFESHGSEKADYSIRSIISEGELRLLVTCKNEKTGMSESREIVIPAKGVSYAVTTTKAKINSENQTRLFDLYIDESSKQSREILRAHCKPVNKELTRKENRPYQALQLLLQPYDVYIPYLGILADTFPVDKVRCRRDFPRFENLIKAHALLYQDQREKTEIGSKTYLIATIDDYRIAYELSQVVLSQTLKEITPRQERILEAIKKYFPDSEFAQKDVRELKEHKDINPRILKEEIYNLRDAGYLEHNGKDGTNSRFVIINMPQEMLKLPTPEKLLSMIDVPMSHSQKSESLHETSSKKWDMSHKRPNVPIGEELDNETKMGHVPKNDTNSFKSLDNYRMGHRDTESKKKKIEKIREDTFMLIDYNDKGEEMNDIIDPSSPNFRDVREAYEQQQSE